MTTTPNTPHNRETTSEMGTPYTLTTPIQETWQDELKKDFTDEIYICGRCKHGWENHYWNGGGNIASSGYDACHLDGCECGYPVNQEVRKEINPEYKRMKKLIQSLLQRKERETISKAIEFFSKHKNEPLTGNVVILELMRMRGDFK